MSLGQQSRCYWASQRTSTLIFSIKSEKETHSFSAKHFPIATTYPWIILIQFKYEWRSDLEKHLTIENCDKIFLKIILRLKKLLKNDRRTPYVSNFCLIFLFFYHVIAFLISYCFVLVFFIYRLQLTNIFWLDNDVWLASKPRRFLTIF